MATNPAPDVNPSADTAVSPEPKFFLASKTVWIAILGVFLVPLLKKAGIQFSDADTQGIADLLEKLATLLGVVWARSKAQGPLHFGNGMAAVLLAFALVGGLLTGCMGSTLKLPRTRVTYHSDFGSVSYDGKTLTTDFNGGEVAPGLSVSGGGKF